MNKEAEISSEVGGLCRETLSRKLMQLTTRTFLLSLFVLGGCAGLSSDCSKNQKRSQLQVGINLPSKNRRGRISIETPNVSINWNLK